MNYIWIERMLLIKFINLKMASEARAQGAMTETQVVDNNVIAICRI